MITTTNRNETYKSIHVIAVQLEVEELGVRFNTVLGQTLRKNDVSVLNTPSEQDPVKTGCNWRSWLVFDVMSK